MTRSGRLPAAQLLLVAGLAGLAGLASVSCADSAPERVETDSPADTPAVAIDTAAVRGATFMSQYAESGFVTLSDGRFESVEPEWRLVSTLDEHLAIGDLDGDGTVEAAALLWTNTGGSGAFVDLAVLDARDGEVVNSALAFLGDRLRIHALSIGDGRIHLDATMHAPDDPMCCPTLRVTRRFRLEHGGLVEVDPPEGVMK